MTRPDAGTVAVAGVRQLTRRRARCYRHQAASREVLQDRGPLRDDASGVGNGRQEVAERQEDSIRRLSVAVPTLRGSGRGAALLCDGAGVAGRTPQGVRSGQVGSLCLSREARGTVRVAPATGRDAGTASESPKSNPATFLENSTVCEKPVPTPSHLGLAPRGTVPWRIRITDEPRAVQGMAPAPPIPPVRPGRMVNSSGSRATRAPSRTPPRASCPREFTISDGEFDPGSG